MNRILNAHPSVIRESKNTFYVEWNLPEELDYVVLEKRLFGYKLIGKEKGVRVATCKALAKELGAKSPFIIGFSGDVAYTMILNEKDKHMYSMPQANSDNMVPFYIPLTFFKGDKDNTLLAIIRAIAEQDSEIETARVVEVDEDSNIVETFTLKIKQRREEDEHNSSEIPKN